MENQHLDKWNSYAYEGAAIEEETPDFSGLPLWNWQFDCLLGEEVIDATPLMQSYPSDPFFPTQDLFRDDLYSMFEGEIGIWNEMRDGSEPKRKEALAFDQEKRGEGKVRKVERNIREEKAMTFEEVSRYFYMPITQAAKELNVGLTLLKKKCRELGIPRWPHRKMKSLQTLINNVKELGREDSEDGEAQLRSAVEILEQERKLMEKEPAIQMEEKTKRLRQACFKANYKKRKLMALERAQDPAAPSLLCDEYNDRFY